MKIEVPLVITIENPNSMEEAMKDIETFFRLKNLFSVEINSSIFQKFEIVDDMIGEE